MSIVDYEARCVARIGWLQAVVLNAEQSPQLLAPCAHDACHPGEAAPPEADSQLLSSPGCNV